MCLRKKYGAGSRVRPDVDGDAGVDAVGDEPRREETSTDARSAARDRAGRAPVGDRRAARLPQRRLVARPADLLVELGPHRRDDLLQRVLDRGRARARPPRARRGDASRRGRSPPAARALTRREAADADVDRVHARSPTTVMTSFPTFFSSSARATRSEWSRASAIMSGTSLKARPRRDASKKRGGS